MVRADGVVMDWKWLVAVWAIGTGLIVTTAPRGVTAVLWECLPGFAHRIIARSTGYEMVKHVTAAGRETYYWRKCQPCPGRATGKEAHHGRRLIESETTCPRS